MPKMEFRAQDMKSGMSLEELASAVKTASDMRLTRISRVVAGFRGQLQKITFEEGIGAAR